MSENLDLKEMIKHFGLVNGAGSYADFLEERGDPRGAYVRLWCKMQEIIARPEDDAPRLEFAAMLADPKLPPPPQELREIEKELPGIVRIGRYHSTGKEYAEFIRLQCELGKLTERMHTLSDAEMRQGESLDKASYSLLNQHGDAWVQDSFGQDFVSLQCYPDTGIVAEPGRSYVAFKRGFPSRITLIQDDDDVEPATLALLPGPPKVRDLREPQMFDTLGPSL